MQIVEHAEPLGRCEIDTDLFVGFADRGIEQVGIARLTTPTWKRDLSRPRVTDSYRAMDEERFETIVGVMEYHRDSRGYHPSLKGNFYRSIIAQPAAGNVQRSHLALDS